jgi:hypothetical protein
MSQPISIAELIERIPGLSQRMRPGSEEAFTVTGLADGGKEAAGQISRCAKEHGLFAFAPRGDEITLYKLKWQGHDSSISVVSVSLD